jgi:putative transcriptional regulator
MAMAKSKLLNQIRKLRFETSEMTQQELALRVGVTRQTIIAIEHRKYSPSLELAFRIARAFGKRVEEVFQSDEEPSPPDGTAAKALGPDAHL